MNKVSIFALVFLIISVVALLSILTNHYNADYLLAYGVPLSIVTGFSLISFVLATKKS